MTADAHSDWVAWHREYDEPGSRLSRRLGVVQAHIRVALAGRSGAVRIISMCAGEGRDVLPVLAEHPLRVDISALLVELDPNNAEMARAAARRAQLARVEVRCADASVTDAYEDAVPADIILACGIFGNISLDDIKRTVEHLPSLAAPGATVIWTRGRWKGLDVTPDIRRWFSESGFEEVVFDGPADVTYAVGSHRLVSAPRPLEHGVRLFTFFR